MNSRGLVVRLHARLHMWNHSNERGPAAFSLDETMERLSGDRELFRELAELLIETLPGMMDKGRIAMLCADGINLANAAHTLKGCLAVFGAEAANTTVRDLELAAKKNNFESAPQLFRELESRLEVLVLELRCVLNLVVEKK